MNPHDYVVRCEHCFRSVRITDMKQLKRFKELHTENTCGHYIPTLNDTRKCVEVWERRCEG